MAVDFNGDGNLDLVTSGAYLLLGKGDGTFGPAQMFPGGGGALVIGDFNGDGKPDVAALDSLPAGVVALLNTGVICGLSTDIEFPFRCELYSETYG